MKYLVRIENLTRGSTRHKVYKTENGARNFIFKMFEKAENNGDVLHAELYKQESIMAKQLQLDLSGKDF